MNDQSVNQDNCTAYVQGIEDIKQCWKNIMFTVPGTFPLLPEFGCDMFKYLDKPITESFGKLRNIIIAALEKWEPRAKINKVTRVINGSQVVVNISGTQINTGLPVYTAIDISTGGTTQLLNYTAAVPVTIVITGGEGHDRLHGLSSLLDHAAVDSADKGKILTTDTDGAINFTNVIDGGEI